MFGFDIERVRANVQKASTEDLLDRVTAYRSALEPAAVEAILEELRRRGITAEAIVQHDVARRQTIADANGHARMCTFCAKPAVVSGWGWHRLFGKVPVFPRLFYWCDEHRPVPPVDDEADPQ